MTDQCQPYDRDTPGYIERLGLTYQEWAQKNRIRLDEQAQKRVEEMRRRNEKREAVEGMKQER